MLIPRFHEMRLPLLRCSADGNEWTVAALRNRSTEIAVGHSGRGAYMDGGISMPKYRATS